MEKKVGDPWKHHLYSNTEGEFFEKLNGWEQELLKEAMEEKGFLGWLRNLPRRDWALCIPYELAGKKAFYPDFVVFRKRGTGFLADIIEPHDTSRADAWAKAKGLAEFADLHGIEFGRLLFVRKQGDNYRKIDLNNKTTREKARKMQSQSDLESLFG
ncbi:MAG: hypothetical protein M3P27_03775 [Acidobacteriota bacterium]|nr:hypothetical protein [Acidobacteriota bacterium]